MIRCLIIDDEPGAHEVLVNYINRVAELELCAQAYDAIQANSILKSSAIDLIFLDINMPEISGLEFIEMLQTPPQIILTTAHSEHALEAYDKGVIDYLLKPIPFPRFLKAINKAQAALALQKPEEVITTITLKVDGLEEVFLFSDIQYFESVGNYVKVVAKPKPKLTLITLNKLEEMLPKSAFIRVHKSYIVPTEVAKQAYKSDFIAIDNVQIPIGRTYKMLINSL
jgi:two-component system, LytTR family, response regulator